MTGQRSLAETYANEVLSAVDAGAVIVRFKTSYFSRHRLTCLCVELHSCNVCAELVFGNTDVIEGRCSVQVLDCMPRPSSISLILAGSTRSGGAELSVLDDVILQIVRSCLSTY